MTFVEKCHKDKKHHISICVQDGLYVVQVCPAESDHYVGYPIRKITYPITDKKKAYATYRRYLKKYAEKETPKTAEVFHLGKWTECKIETEYSDGTFRIAIPQYDYRGFRNGEWCETVPAEKLRKIK